MSTNFDHVKDELKFTPNLAITGTSIANLETT
jgi:hypothetical protein